MKQLFQEDFNMLRILIDSSADFMLEEAKKLNIEIIRLPVYFGEEIYYQEDDPEFKNFFKKADIASIHPKTSRANPNDYLQVFEDVKNKNDEMLVMTISSRISGSYESAYMAYKEINYDKIKIIDSQSVCLGLRQLTMLAIKLRDEGLDLNQIYNQILEASKKVRVWAILDTMNYVKKGGRISKYKCLIVNLLKIKPCGHVVDGKIEVATKGIGLRNAVGNAINYSLKEKLDFSKPIMFGYTVKFEHGQMAKKVFDEKIKTKYIDGGIHPNGAVIGTHLGPNAITFSYFVK